MRKTSLRWQLLRTLAIPLLMVFAVGSGLAFFFTIKPAILAYDDALGDTAHAVALHVRFSGSRAHLELPPQAERLLRWRTNARIYFQVDGLYREFVGGDRNLPPPPFEPQPGEPLYYDGVYEGNLVRVVALAVPHARGRYLIRVAETTTRRDQLELQTYIGVLIPALLLAAAMILLTRNGIARALKPLMQLRNDIAARSHRDLRPVDETRAPLELQAFVHAINDLLERLARATDAQQRFLANAAHQLRTPLAGLRTQLELALKLPATRELQQALERIHRATERTARLANQLLALARAEPGGYHGDRLQATDLRAVIDEAANQWVRQALDKDIDLGFELAPAPLEAEPFLVRELLANLVDNAIAYTPPGGRVTVRCFTRDQHACLEVEDDGPGIPIEERQKVLERFYRLPGSPGTGSGLGLAIVREIAQAHGATLLITDAAGGRGTLVSVCFPPPAA
ncbi:MAG: sensor histidine kinase [Pseudomonadota bacterium]